MTALHRSLAFLLVLELPTIVLRSFRSVLLSALLVACASDLPTAPSAAESGIPSPLPAALPPLPTPPTVLNGTLPGADGAPVTMDLGVWESPVLAEITVAGLLHYAGATGGYYPGAGSFDYQGRYIPFGGSCASQVSVRVHNGGPVGGAFGYCPGSWQAVGSVTRYALVQGAVYVDRTPPAPGACFYGTTGCASITGAQEVTLTPVPGELRIVVDTPVARPNGYIKATFVADPEWAHDVRMPLTLRGVTWEGSGPILGGGTPIGCTTWLSATSCLVKMAQSGYLVADGIVSGEHRVARQWLTLIGGDSVPPVPPDTVPVDSIPSDTTGGGGGDGGVGCRAAPARVHGASLATGDCNTPSVDLKCVDVSGSNRIVRGGVATCTVEVTPSSAQLSVLGWSARGTDGNEAIGPTSGSTWSGRVALDTKVTARYTMDGGEAAEASTEFTVAPRPWSFGVSGRAVPESWSPSPDGGSSIVILPYPPTGVTGQLGKTSPWDDEFNAKSVIGQSYLIVEGPNAGWMITTDPYPDLAPHVFLNRGLRSEDAFYQLQNGRKIQGADSGDPRLDYYCSARQMDMYLALTRAHEGSTGSSQSHIEIYRDRASSLNLNAGLEKVVGFTSDYSDESLRKFYDQVNDAFLSWDASMGSVQAALHDQPNGRVPITCVFRQPEGK